MKNFINILSLLIFSIMLFSCEKELELEPQQSISNDQAISTPENIRNILIGSYATATHEFMLGGRTQIYSELLGNNVSASNYVYWYGTFGTLRQMNSKTLTSDNAYVEGTWERAYRLIFTTNTILENINVITDVNERTRIIGEAKFLRAIAYFELVKLYGKSYIAGQNNTQLGVPIILTSKIDFSKDLSIARNTVEEVYNRVITDLNDAITGLPSQNSYYATQNATKALLARVYLQKGDFSNARLMSNDIIQNGGYSLNINFSNAFNNSLNTSEDIFALHITTQSGFNSFNQFFADEPNGGRRGDIAVRGNYVSLFENQDVRGNFFYLNVFDDLLTSKFKFQFGNIPYIRLAEMYLIRAESNFRLGTNVGDTPVNDIKQIRDRAGASNLATITLNDILLERRRELGFEGFLLHDIKRTQGVLGSGNWVWNSDKLVLPIPLREMQVNTKLVQNPGYN